MLDFRNEVINYLMNECFFNDYDAIQKNITKFQHFAQFVNKV